MIVNGTWGGTPTRDNFSDKTISLGANIDLSNYAVGEGWVPISGFSGNFNGNEYIISNLTINRPNAAWQGLFGRIYNGTVTDLGLEGINIHGFNGVGGVVGSAEYGERIINCYSTGTVSGINQVGGIVGTISGNGSITHSYSTATISGIDNVGGVVGMVSNSNVTNCYSTGIVSGNGNVGGVVGTVSFSVGDNITLTITNSYSTGAVTGNSDIGGLVGLVDFYSGNNHVMTVTNSAALNPEIRGNVSAGRIIGGVRVNSMSGSNSVTLSNNVAYAEMINNTDDNTWTDKGVDKENGADITAAAINTDSTIGGRFTLTDGWTTQSGRLPGLNGQAVPMPAHLSDVSATLSYDRVIPQDSGNDDLAVVTPTVNTLTGELTAGPNPVGRTASKIAFFRQGRHIKSGTLSIYNASGNLINKVKIADNTLNSETRRQIGSWDLKDTKGQPVPEGTYLVKGVVITLDEKRERVSVMVGVQR